MAALMRLSSLSPAYSLHKSVGATVSSLTVRVLATLKSSSLVTDATHSLVENRCGLADGSVMFGSTRRLTKIRRVPCFREMQRWVILADLAI